MEAVVSGCFVIQSSIFCINVVYKKIRKRKTKKIVKEMEAKLPPDLTNIVLQYHT